MRRQGYFQKRGSTVKKLKEIMDQIKLNRVNHVCVCVCVCEREMGVVVITQKYEQRRFRDKNKQR
jgi:hypothetical protein